MKRIVILGAGFGGLRAATLIARKLHKLNLSLTYEVTLVDRNSYHTYTPLLYEIAAVSRNITDAAKLQRLVTVPLLSLVKRLPITFVQGEVRAVDLMKNTVSLANGAVIDAEHIVLALGSETNFFDIKGLKEHALTFKSLTDAIHINDAMLSHIQSGTSLVRIVIGGGGSTGVELASELKFLCEQFHRSSLACRFDVRIIEAKPTILHNFDPRIIASIKRRLAKIGVETIEHETISAVTKETIRLESGRTLPYDILVWTGGIAPPALLSQLPLKKTPRGQFVTTDQMECAPNAPDIALAMTVYAIGDTVIQFDPITKRSLPNVARAALDQASVVAHNLLEDVKLDNGLTRSTAKIVSIPREYPYVIPAGGKFAVAKIGDFVLSGLSAWFLKGLVEFRYLASIMPILYALKMWLRGLRVFIQNDRLG
jgi:NADH:ubiquinone reductase (H+-translocating)